MAVINKISDLDLLPLPSRKVSYLKVISITDNTVPSRDRQLFLELGMFFGTSPKLDLNELNIDVLARNRIRIFDWKSLNSYWTSSLTHLTKQGGIYYLSTEGVTYQVVLEDQKD